MKKKWLLLLVLPLVLLGVLRWQMRLKATHQVVAVVNGVSDAYRDYNDDLYHFQMMTEMGIDYDFIKSCMARGADLNLLPDRGADVFKRVFVLHDFDVIKLLETTGAHPDLDTQLFLAAYKREPSTFTELLRKGANPNARDFLGTPVSFYTLSGISKEPRAMLDELIKAGLDINAQAERDRNNTLLLSAIIYTDPKTIDILLSHHANVFIKNVQNDNAITAIQGRSYELGATPLRHLYAEAHRQKLALLQSKAKVIP